MTTVTPNSSKKLGLTARIFIGMAIGIAIGTFIQLLSDDSGDFSFSVFNTEFSTYGFLVEGIFTVMGTLFIKALKMLVVPLVFVSLVCGTANLSDPSKLGRLGGKAVGLYISTTAIAITLAIVFAIIVAPGEGINLATDATYAAKEAPSLAQVIIDMMPANPVESMAQGNMLQIIVFAAFFGVAMAMIKGEPAERLRTFFDDLNEVIMKIVTIVMNLAPYGVFALMAKLAATTELRTFQGLSVYFLFVHALVTYPIVLKLLSGLNPLILLSKMRDTAIFAFSTASSSATLPVTIETATKKLGVKNSVASFTLSLGSTVNMDGTAIMQGVATVFIAQVYNVDLSVSDYLMVVLTATLASIGTAGVPGVGLLMLAMVLQQVNLPVEGIALIIGVDRLLDMTRTAVNVTGDCVVSCIVAKSENELDERIYNDRLADQQ
jgi:Na+/H+-dicarboxylate symporter